MRERIEYLIGMLVLTLGVCLIVIGNIGASPWDSVSLGFVSIYGLNLGQWTFIVGVVLVMFTTLMVSHSVRHEKQNLLLASFFVMLLALVFLVALVSWFFLVPLLGSIALFYYIVNKNKLRVKYASIVAGLMTGFFIEMWFKILGVAIPDGLITCIIGIIMLALGIAIYTRVNIAPNPIDYFMVFLVDAFNISITKAKLLTDAIGITIGLLIGGPIGIGTILIVILTGPLVGFFAKFINHLDTSKK